jgi:hypothetical protein
MKIHYEIRLKETLDSRWLAWFEGFELRAIPAQGTQLSVDLPDQAALFGILEQIRDLNLTLISVVCTTYTHSIHPQEK